MSYLPNEAVVHDWIKPSNHSIRWEHETILDVVQERLDGAPEAMRRIGNSNALFLAHAPAGTVADALEAVLGVGCDPLRLDGIAPCTVNTFWPARGPKAMR